MRNVLNGTRSACGQVWDFTQSVVVSASKAVSKGACKYVLPLMLVAVMLTCCFGAGDVFAQGAGSTTVEFESIVEFGDLFTTLTDAIGPLIAGALMLGLGIWGTYYIFTNIKRMAR